jgi:dolichol-phosphate mannosyltransferase
VAELAVIIPTFNEVENVRPLLEALDRVLAGIEYEVVFVDDDSDDGTAGAVRAIAQSDARVRILQRVGRRGLSSAVVEGMMATSTPYLAVMDGDMQHDESALPRMLEKLKAENLELVVGSRNIAGGSMGEFAASRVKLSQLGRRLSSFVSHTDLSDPMSGFFMLTRQLLARVVHSLSGRGFKILLDLVASSHEPVRFGEVPYTFRNRVHGESKLDILVGLEYIELLADKVVGRWIPVSYVLFALVGSFGLAVSIAAVYILLHTTPLTFSSAQIVMSVAVITLNFLLNNQLTFRGSRLRGMRLIRGLVLFHLACGVGLVCNWQLAELLRDHSIPWWAASLAGTAVGSVWNYWVSSVLVWRVNRRKIEHRARTAALAASLR